MLSFELFLADFNWLEYKFVRKSLDHLKLEKKLNCIALCEYTNDKC